MQDTIESASSPSILDGGWIRAVIIVFLVESLLLLYFSTVQLQQPLRQILVNQYNGLQGITNAPLLLSSLYIFSHNYIVATVELIPILGIITFTTSVATTALTVGALGSTTGVSGPAYIFFLYTLPHTWLELPAYAIALTESLYVIAALYNALFHGKPIREWSRMTAAWALIAIELAVAAIFEASEIKLAQINPVYAYLTWFPFAILAGIVLILWMKLSSRRSSVMLAAQSMQNAGSGSVPAPAAIVAAPQTQQAVRSRRRRATRKVKAKGKRRRRK